MAGMDLFIAQHGAGGVMIRSYEAEVSEDGQVRLLDPLVLRGRHRAVLTLLEPLETNGENTQTSESLASKGGAALVTFFAGEPVAN
ncbi:MAG: hypothetical protein H7839_13005 [Magnetococcus sp. YQC-5]